MFRIIFILILSFSTFVSQAQSTAGQLIDEGIKLHDQGEFEAAVARYNEAIKLEPDNYKAKYEKSLSLTNLKQYKEAEVLLKDLLKNSKDPEFRRLSYVNYGTLMDYQGEGKKSLKIYDEGIKEFPTSYLLYFNKGITQAGMNLDTDAIESFKQSVKNNPLHASSHNALGRLISGSNRIPGILSIFTFLVIEPQSKRANDNRIFLYKLLMKGVETREGGGVNITIDAALLDKKNQSAEVDNFSSAELIVSVLGANNAVADSLGLKSEADRLSIKMQTLINVIGETKGDKGFFKSFYVPFFAEMKKKDLVTVASYLALASSDDKEVKDWIDTHKDEINAFYDWLKEYKWQN